MGQYFETFLRLYFINVCNKLECLSVAEIQSSLMVASEAGSLPWSGTPERCFTRVGFDLTLKHPTRLERLARKNTLAYYEHS